MWKQLPEDNKSEISYTKFKEYILTLGLHLNADTMCA